MLPPAKVSKLVARGARLLQVSLRLPIFPDSSFLRSLRGWSADWRTDARLLGFPGRPWGPALQPSLAGCFIPATSAPGPDTPPPLLSCSPLNCLQLSCIDAMTRCLQRDAVSSVEQRSRPEARSECTLPQRAPEFTRCPLAAWQHSITLALLPTAQGHLLKKRASPARGKVAEDNAHEDRKNLKFQRQMSD